MNKKIRDLVEEHRREKWTEHLEKCDLRNGVKRLWNTIKTLSGIVKKTGSEAITFEKPVYDPKEISNKFNQQYTPPIRKSRAGNSSDAPELEDQLHGTRYDYHNGGRESTSKHKTFQGPRSGWTITADAETPGIEAPSYIAGMFQTSLNKGVIPSIWKTARIIPLLKPGKPDNTR